KPQEKKAQESGTEVKAQNAGGADWFGNVWMWGAVAGVIGLAAGIGYFIRKGTSMSKLTVGKRNGLGFAAVLAITVCVGGYAFTRLDSLDHDAASITTDALPGVSECLQTKACMVTNFGRLFKHISSNKGEDMDAVEAAMHSTSEEQTKHMEAYGKTIHEDVDRKNFEAFKSKRGTYTDIRKEVLALSRAGKKAEALALANEKMESAFAVYISGVQVVVDWNLEAGNEKSQQITSNVGFSKKAIMGGVGAALLVGAGLAFFISRGVNKSLTRMASALGDGANQVAAASGQVAASSQSLAQGASEQAASLEETTSALEETASMTKKNAETAHQAAALAGETKSAADRGNDAMKKMGSAINDIQKSAAETAKIIKVIDEIAFQTNLLALNAAVEAAHAG
ncbi:MAG: MCP four helix bundle domain-containing protein, partial [Opitutus sp.]